MKTDSIYSKLSTLLNALMVLSGVVVLYSTGWSTILQVPTFYPTIQSAVTESQPGDTIHLAQGNYLGGICLPHDLTFTSSYMFTPDTAVIELTTWQTDTNRISISGHAIRFTGIRFIAPNLPMANAGIFRGENVDFKMTHCIIDGVYDDNLSFSSGLLYFSTTPPSIIRFDECRYRNDFLGRVPLVRAVDCSTTFERCSFVGRSSQSIAWLVVGDGSLTIRRSYLRMEGEGIFASMSYIFDNTSIVKMGSTGLYLGSNNYSSNRYFNNCVIDSTYQTSQFYVFDIWGRDNNTKFNGCVFKRSTNGNLCLISSQGVPQFSNCTFEENNVVVLGVDKCAMDSCRFINNSAPIFVHREARADSIRISNSDFIGNNGSFTANWEGLPEFDTIIAPNCYWGDSTGPNHPLNPGGLGQTLPAFVNPFPFRTTPVFPDVAAPEPSESNSTTLPQPFQFSLYPNPTNGSATIRFSLPPTSPVTGVLYDYTGRQVSTFSLNDANRRNGVYPLSLVNTPSGMYFVRLTTTHSSSTQSLLLIK